MGQTKRPEDNGDDFLAKFLIPEELQPRLTSARWKPREARPPEAEPAPNVVPIADYRHLRPSRRHKP